MSNNQISRLYNFQDGTKASADQVDAEFDQLIAAHNADDLVLNAHIIKQVNPSDTDQTRDKHVSNADIKSVNDQITNIFTGGLDGRYYTKDDLKPFLSGGDTIIIEEVYKIINPSVTATTFTYSDNTGATLTGTIDVTGKMVFPLLKGNYSLGQNRVEVYIDDTARKSVSSGGLVEVDATHIAIDSQAANKEVTIRYFQRSGLTGEHNIIVGPTQPPQGNDNTLWFKVIDSTGGNVVDTVAPIVSVFPNGGSFTSAQTVILSSNETATIFYTLDGTTPTVLSSVYFAPITLNQTTVLKFFGRDSTGNSSAVQTVNFTFTTSDTTAPTVTALPGTGTYTTVQSITLSANESATIYYTVDGSTPTTSSTQYSSPIPINATTTLKYFGKDAAGNSSSVQTATYTINLDTTAPVVTASPVAGSYATAQTVTITANEQATIYYTLDGTTPTTNSNIYTAALNISSTTILKFFAKDVAGNSSIVQTVNYTITASDTTAPTIAAAPVGGTYATTQNVTLSANEAASVYYTISGNAPTTSTVLPRVDKVVVCILENHTLSSIQGSSSAPYINSLMTQGANLQNYKAIEHPSQPNYFDLFAGSNMGITDNVYRAPQFNTPNLYTLLAGSNYSFIGYSQSQPSDGYTGDGSGAYPYAARHNPWKSFVNVPASSNLTFASFPSNFASLPTVSYVVPDDLNNMHDGTIQACDTWLQTNMDPYVQWAKNNNSLFILVFDEDDTTGNNTVPCVFVGPMVKAGNNTTAYNHYSLLRTILDFYGVGYVGNAATATPITDVWKTPLTTLAPASGTYLYQKPLPITATTTLKYFGRDVAGNNSAIQTQSYTINADTVAPIVTPNPAAGTYTSTQAVTLSADEQATIYYTTNGTTPTTSSAVYSTPISISSTTTLKYFAKDLAGNTSTVQSATYTINAADTTPPTVTLSPAAGTFTSVQSVTMTANETATIYYTLDGSAPTTASTVYTGPIAVNSTTTIKYFAKDTAGNASAVQTAVYTINIADTTPPNNVTNLTVSNLASNSLTLNWTASTSIDIASYDVYNGSTLLGNTASTTYNVTGLTASTTYTFWVKAKDTSSNVASGTSVNATTTAGSLVSDSFNRTASTTSLGSTDSAYGGTTKTWALQPASGGTVYGIDASGKAYPATTSVQRTHAIIDTGQANGTIECVVTGMDGSTQRPKIAIRAVDENNVVYLGVGPGSGLNYLELYSYQSGNNAGNVWTSVNAGKYLTNGDTLKVNFVGSTYTIYINGVQVDTPQTLTFNQTATKHGFNMYNYNTARIDDWKFY